ncbi:MAG: radical SAM protein [Kiritimatiellae bacterium]|jgi:uncharacterized protein|nr:radical SAM protein [Kiritimatiellia bacterium]
MKQVTLSVTNHCNLDCKYCYVKAGDWEEENISPEKVRKIVGKEICSGDEASFLFFGGEPLLNTDAIYETRDILRKIPDVTAYLLTISNGTFPECEYKQLIDSGIMVSISCDGPPEINAQNRSSISQSERVIDNIRFLVREGAIFKVRMTVTKDNIKNLSETVRYFSDLGVKYLHFESISPYKLGKFEYPFSATEFSDAVKRAIDVAGETGMSLINSAFMNLLSPSDKFCQASHSNQRVYSNSYVSPCLRIQQESKDFKPLCDIDRTFVSVDDKQQCSECDIKYFCGGGCPYINYAINYGLLDIPDAWGCDYRRKIIPFIIEHANSCATANKLSPVLGIYSYKKDLWENPSIGTMRSPNYVMSNEDQKWLESRGVNYDLIQEIFGELPPSSLLRCSVGCF